MISRTFAAISGDDVVRGAARPANIFPTSSQVRWLFPFTLSARGMKLMPRRVATTRRAGILGSDSMGGSSRNSQLT